MNTRTKTFLVALSITCANLAAATADGDAQSTRGPTVADTEKTSWKQMHQLAQQLNAGAYMYVPEGALLFTAGEAIDYSGRDEEGLHESGATLDSGVWLFPENSVIQWPDGQIQVLQSDTVVVPQADLNVRTASSGKGSSIECQEGFWACCNLTNASCIRQTDINNHTCQSGGEGAVSCSISDSL